MICGSTTLRLSTFRSTTFLTFLFLIALIFLVIPSATAQGDGCEDCHSGFTVFPAEIVAPLEVPDGVEFELKLIVTNPSNNDDSGDDGDDGYPHDLLNVQAELNLSDVPNIELATGSPSILTAKISSGDSVTIIWSLISSEPGLSTMRCDISATAYYDHTSDDPDTHSYVTAPILHTVDVKPLPIRLSKYSLSTLTGQEKGHEIVLTTREPITDLEMSLSESLRGFANLTIMRPDDQGSGPESGNANSNGNETGNTTFIGDLNASELLNIAILLFSEREGTQGSLTISWVNFTGIRQSINLSISIIEPPRTEEGSINWYSVTGQVSGILLLGSFIASIFLGGFPSGSKAYFRRIKFTAGNRVRLHCYVSYFIIGLSIAHMLVLLLGPWGDSMFGGPLKLGYIGVLLLIVLGIHGRYQKLLIKKYGYKVWIKSHQYLTMGIILLGLVHAFKIGTHFEFIRGLL